ncbi:MAG TPA: nicotinamidase, partial [Porphyromonadaceae bacterium]|nr:nicotinamidase [Porphyromonadaceae bacterium]
QNDFCPGGALGVKDGDKVVPVINSIMERFDLVISSQDWHPADSVHFEKWPVHCVAGTHGADFHPELDCEKIDLKLQKGTDNQDDGYSAFEATNVALADYLRECEISAVYVCGLTTDYCVKETALDAVKQGFQTYVITDAIAPVNAQPGDDKKALQEMYAAGCILVESDEIR